MAEKKEKPKPVAKKKSKITKPYVKGKKDCPKCGAGVKLADHKDRRSCGKCGYFEKKS
jgi:small subunit ribosomal protein S27Ae